MTLVTFGHVVQWILVCAVFWTVTAIACEAWVRWRACRRRRMQYLDHGMIRRVK